MSPEYFARALSLYEAKLFIAGLDRRYRAGWMQARYAGFWSAMPHVKNFEYGKMPRFAWEEEEHSTPVDEEEEMRAIEQLRAYALKRDEQLLNKKEDGKR